MNTILKNILSVVALTASLNLYARASFNYANWHTQKEELTKLYLVAEEQKERVLLLLNDSALDLRKVSLDEVNSTIKYLEKEQQVLEQYDSSIPVQAREEIDKAQLLVIELMRQLKETRRLYRERVETLYATAKKIALPIGIGLSVTGGLLVTNLLHITNLDFSTTLLSGLLTGGVVGVIVYQDEVKRGLGKAMEKMGDMVGIPLDGKTVRSALKITATVAGTAAAGAVLYIKRDALKRLLGLKRKGTPLSRFK
jgi:hypothetical protein